jgi:hypothetical protein
LIVILKNVQKGVHFLELIESGVHICRLFDL